jgi:hypothetical protein
MAGETEKPEVPYLAPELDVELDQLRDALGGPALFSNKMYATSTLTGLRITFCEAHPALSRPAFRTAVYMDYGQAIALRDLLNHQLKDLEIVTPPSEV